MRILFQGDSITDGNRYKDDASHWDLNHQIGHSWAYIVSALLGCKYPQRFEFVNRAVSGNTVDELNQRWDEDTIAVKPDVLCILIGTNDCTRNVDGERDMSCTRFEQGYRTLLQRARADNPKLGLILLEPFAYSENELRVPVMKRNQEIVRGLADEFDALLVPLQAKFDAAAKQNGHAYWIWDNIHPTEAGHGLIATAFLEAAEETLTR